MSYTEMAQLELMNAAANVTSQEDLDAWPMSSRTGYVPAIPSSSLARGS